VVLIALQLWAVQVQRQALYSSAYPLFLLLLLLLPPSDCCCCPAVALMALLLWPAMTSSSALSQAQAHT
jgi:hypothetical protein